MAEFTGTTYEEAVAQAEIHFDAIWEDLAISVLEEGGEDKALWRISAERTDPCEIEADNAEKETSSSDNVERIRLTYAAEGVLLDAPRSASDIEIASYITRRGVRGYDLPGARRQIENGTFPVMLAPAQVAGPAAADDVYVTFTKDDMTARLLLFPGDEDGARLSFDDVMATLTGPLKITCGIDEDAVRRVTERRPYRQEIEIAHGIMPVEGQQARIDFHFRLSTTMRPKLIDGDRVDYRTLDLFVAVKAGDVLVTRVPATQGVDGQSLRGRPLRARSGKDKLLPRGKGVTISEDKCTMTAATDGMVSYKDNVVIVTSRFVVDENVDMSTGNIDFTGDIEVRGNVIAGMTLRAGGSIEIHGSVEAATIVAGGDVVLRQGMNRGSVQAGGDVTARYFERARVSARGVISTDAMYYSDCSAVEGITLAGKRGILIGGVTRSANVVAARTIGSESDVVTTVEVGILPVQRERLVFLENEIVRLNNEKGKLAVLVKTYGAVPKENEPPKHAELRKRVLEANRQNIMQLAQAATERDKIRAEIETATSGRVHVTGTAFPGAKIVIGSSVYNVETPIDFATFRMSNGELSFTACEL